MRRWTLLLCFPSIFLCALLHARPALAVAPALVQEVQAAGYFDSLTVYQAPDVTWTFTTSNLSAGTDTILSIQYCTNCPTAWAGPFIAGNDDYNGSVASQVVVPPGAIGRYLRVVIRAYSSTTQGTCTMTATKTGGTPGGPWVFPNVAARQPSAISLGEFAWGGYVTASEIQGQSTDVALTLINEDDPATVIYYDDDGGVGSMPFITVGSCHNCVAIVENYASVQTQSTRLVADSRAPSVDADGDGLSAALEALLGTSDSSVDTDQDGIDDDIELLGLDGDPPVKFPTWGADPLQKDLFFEADWEACTPSDDPAICPFGADTKKLGVAPGTDQGPTASFVAQVKHDFSPVRVHMDVGTPNADPATWQDWGDWGGATRIAIVDPPNDDPCRSFTPTRGGFFHHLNIGVEGSSGLGPCHFISPFRGTVSHETGHGLGLFHGGRPHVGALNMKPNYASVMNYMYWFTSRLWHASSQGYSHGDFPLHTINPTMLSESLGLSTASSLILNKINETFCPGAATFQNGSFVNSCVQGTAIDWNRDGIFESSGTVRAAVDPYSYVPAGFSVLPAGNMQDPAMTWNSAGGNVGDQLWIFGRRASDGQLQYIHKARTSLEAGCGSLSEVWADEWAQNCAGLSIGDVQTWPGSKPIVYAPGVGEFGSGQIYVLSQGAYGGALAADRVTIDSTTGAITHVAGGSLGIVATGDVTALNTFWGPMVWVPTIAGGIGNTLAQLDNPDAGGLGWHEEDYAQWADGSYIKVTHGIGAVQGYENGESSPHVYAAIPTAPDGVVEFARRESNGRWTKLPIWSGEPGAIGGQPRVQARPGLAYQPFAGQPSYVGRFYMAFTLHPDCTAPYQPTGCGTFMIMTEGNFTSGTSRRFLWIKPVLGFGTGPGGAPGLRGVALLNDLTRDTNLRGALTGPGGDMKFMPLADGIVNANLSDMDDYPYIQGMLRKSLNPAGEPWPAWLP